MQNKARRLPPVLCEALERRGLLTSAGLLLLYDFNGAAAWPQATSVNTAGVAAAITQSAVGTVNTQGTSTASGGMNLNVSAAPASGLWTSEFSSGKLAVTNTETNLGKLTVGFNLSASQNEPVRFRVYSYSSTGQVTGALESDVVPPAANAYVRYSVDLSTMKPSGAGTFVPNSPYVSFSFEIGTPDGWSASGSPTVRLDNLNYSKPAYYVNATIGKDTYSGKTESTAFATPEKAVSVAGPGDIIDVMTGTYNVTYTGTNAINFTTGGTPAAWVTLKNYPGQSPVIYSEYWNAINIGASSASTRPALAYIEVRGLTVQGDSAKVGSRTAPDGAYDPTAATANQYGPYAQYIQPVDPTTGMNSGGTADPRTNGNGISISGGNEANKPHDIRIADNFVENNAGGGIGAGSADRIQIEGNVVRDNCYWDKYATSGISIGSTYSFDSTTGTVTRLIRNNISSGNIHKEMWVRNSPTLTQYSDGNGIIIDVNHNSGGTVLNRTLVENNVTFDNGGSGIHAYNADHVDIFNNVAYLNSASPYLQYGEIFSQSNDTRIYNNILVAPVAAAGSPSEVVNGGSKPSSSNQIYYQNNVYFGGNTAAWSADTYDLNNKTGDPKFVAASVNPALADFRLQSTSPAIATGLNSPLVPVKDALGNVRNGAVDIGAYEYYVATPTIVSAVDGSPKPVTGTTLRLAVVAGDDNGPSNLTYTWSVPVKPSGATTPTFDSNATNASRQPVATFYSAGTYTLLVTVGDAGGATVTSSLVVTVAQTLAGLVVTPASAVVAASGTQRYTVAGVDQFGQPMAASTVTWTANGSGTSIDSSGLLTASTTLGAFSVSASGSGFTALVNGTVTDQTPPTLLSVVSRKTQGTAGVFDLPLSLGDTPTVEPRINGATTLVFTFSEPVTTADGTLDGSEFSITNATFSSAIISGAQLTLNLSAVVDQARTTVMLQGIKDLAGNLLAGTASVTIRSLYGDINGNGLVNSTDIALGKGASGSTVDGSNYLYDINGNGFINSTDIVLLKSLSGDSVD